MRLYVTKKLVLNEIPNSFRNSFINLLKYIAFLIYSLIISLLSLDIKISVILIKKVIRLFIFIV